MRAVMLAVLVVALAFGSAVAKPSKPMPPNVGPGRIAWFDISTTSISKSKDFYGKLFDWKFDSIPGTDLAVEIVSRKLAIGTLRRAEGKISPFNGVVYVQVSDIEESCRKAQELDGTLIPGFPFNLTDRTGAIGLVNDPVGHPVGMYSRTPLPPQKPTAK